MPTERQRMIGAVAQALEGRDLVWAGLRADDVVAISDLPNLAGSFSIVGGASRGSALDGIDFEDLTGVRVDLDAWDIDDHLDTTEVHEFREAMLRQLGGHTALLPYRPSLFLSAVGFARQDRCLNLGLFGSFQRAFEHKPWVELAVANELKLPRVPWRYVADEEQLSVRRMLDDGPLMLRRSRSSGGAGMARVSSTGELSTLWPSNSERFVAVAPFLEDTLPINIGATVWREGVTIDRPSVQLIGMPELTDRPFGYCGNDFGIVGDLDSGSLGSLETSTLAIGRWLRDHGYRGTYGVDYLLHRGQVLFTELNPRFQGSTHASGQLASEADEPGLVLEHLAAMLGIPMPNSLPLEEVARATPPLAHFVVHWDGPTRQVDAESLLAPLQRVTTYLRADVAAKPTVNVDPRGVVARITARSRVTTNGFDLADPWKSILVEWQQNHIPCTTPTDPTSLGR